MAIKIDGCGWLKVVVKQRAASREEFIEKLIANHCIDLYSKEEKIIIVEAGNALSDAYSALNLEAMQLSVPKPTPPWALTTLKRTNYR